MAANIYDSDAVLDYMSRRQLQLRVAGPGLRGRALPGSWRTRSPRQPHSAACFCQRNTIVSKVLRGVGKGTLLKSAKKQANQETCRRNRTYTIKHTCRHLSF